MYKIPLFRNILYIINLFFHIIVYMDLVYYNQLIFLGIYDHLTVISRHLNHTSSECNLIK